MVIFLAKIVQAERSTKKLAFFISEAPPIFDFQIKGNKS